MGCCFGMLTARIWPVCPRMSDTVASVYGFTEQEGPEAGKPALRIGDGIPAAVSSRVSDIIQRVHEEFGSKANVFTPVLLRMDALEGPEFEAMKKAGVYVFIHEEWGCLKVGKSHLNAAKRALQHCGIDNTTATDGLVRMAQLRQSSATFMLVFALQKPNSLHWVLALENYLEWVLKLKINSKRNG